MRHLFIILTGLMLTTALGCKSTQNQTPINSATPAGESSIQPTSTPVAASSPVSSPATAAGRVEACTLLTSADIQAVQGEPLKATKPSQQAGHEFVIDICYYELPTPSNSVSLSLAQPNPAKKDSVREFWENTFGDSEHALAGVKRSRIVKDVMCWSHRSCKRVNRACRLPLDLSAPGPCAA